MEMSYDASATSPALDLNKSSPLCLPIEYTAIVMLFGLRCALRFRILIESYLNESLYMLG